MKFGSAGNDDGQFNLPSDVAVDLDGDIYVTDWGNHRVQMFNAAGQHLSTYLGAATLSKWGTAKLDANSEMYQERMDDCGLGREQEFRSPIALTVDRGGRILILEALRHRLQVYTKG